MKKTFYDHDRNGVERVLTAHFDFEEEVPDTNEVQGTGANVQIWRIELLYKGKKRNVKRFISSGEREKMEQEILDELTDN